MRARGGWGVEQTPPSVSLGPTGLLHKARPLDLYALSRRWFLRAHPRLTAALGILKLLPNGFVMRIIDGKGHVSSKVLATTPCTYHHKGTHCIHVGAFMSVHRTLPQGGGATMFRYGRSLPVHALIVV